MKYLIIFSLLFFTACQSTQAWLKTKPLSFQKGYEEGCENGEEMALNSTIINKKITSQYHSDSQYKQGWDEGYKDCFENKQFDIMTGRADDP